VGVLQRFERRLEGLVGNAFARLFKGQVEPVEVAKALQREAEEKRAVVGSGRVLVPNRYQVELGPTDYDRLAPWEGQLTQTLAEMVQEHVDDESWSTFGDIEVSLTRAEDLPTGVFRITSRVEPDAGPRRRPIFRSEHAGSPAQPGYQAGYPGQPRYPEQPGYAGYAGAPGQPGGPPPVPPGQGHEYGGQEYGGQEYEAPEYGQGYEPGGQEQGGYAEPYGSSPNGHPRQYPEPGGPPGQGYPAQGYPAQPPYPAPGGLSPRQHWLVVDGTDRRIALEPGANVVGRGQDSDLRLADTGVSRRHIEVRFDGQTATLHDLGSTNGTVVNGHRVQSWQLSDGDVIRIGHSVVVYRQGPT
jgi:hypothetical protein